MCHNASFVSCRWAAWSLGLLLTATGSWSQALPGLWGSTLYRVELAVAGTTVTGSFTPADDPQAPPGTIRGQLQPDQRSFLADWTNPEAGGGGTFQTLLLLDQAGLLLRGYRWDDETEPTHFALHRAVNGQVPEPMDPDDTSQPPATAPTTAPVGGAPVAGVSHAACLAHLEDLSLAVTMYADDHLDCLPDAAKWMDQIAPYLADEASLQCPAAPQLRYGYAMNAALSKVARETITDPAGTVLLFESNLGTRNACGKPADAAQPPRHNGANHCVYADRRCARSGAVPGTAAPVGPATPVAPANPIPPATPLPPAKPSAAIVLCQRVDEQNRPVDPATVLSGPAGAPGGPGKPGVPGTTPETVLAVSTLSHIPAGNVIECVWKRDGKEFSRNRSVYAAGTQGIIWKWGPQPGGLPPGDCEVLVLCDGTELARQPFKIVPGPRGPDGPTSPVAPAVTGVFPQTPFNGMQVTYRVTGAALGTPTDTSGFTTTRAIQGRVAGETLTVSGTVRVGGLGADVTVTVWSGGQKDERKFHVKNQGDNGNPTKFTVSVPVAQGAVAGGFTMRVDGRYTMGGSNRALVVTAQLQPPAGTATTVSPATPSVPATPPPSLPPMAAFPGDTLNVMQIRYAVGGATLGVPTETGGTQPALSFEGKMTAGVLTVAGSVKGAGGEGADVIVTLWSGARREEQRLFVKNEGYHAPPTPYSVSLAVNPGDGPAGFSVRVDGRFAPGVSGVRGLLVAGQLQPR